MAIRVDDIVVSEKNVLLLSGGHQFVADIERNSDTLDSGDYTRDRNPWNLYAEDGTLIHNLFDSSSFSIRTQVLTGSSNDSPNNKESHERIYMPNSSKYVGNCQFYGNAYTISINTSDTISSDYKIGCNGELSSYRGEYGFIKYNNLSSYENSTEYYINPDTVFSKSDGVQYITEYPINGYYMDFGDNEDNKNPTIFADSILSKYYLNGEYSVSSYEIDANRNRFNNLRTYYGIGSTGNSIYMVFRNNLNGISTIVSNDGKHVDTSYNGNLDSILSGDIEKIGWMQNFTTMSNSDGIYFSSSPFADFFQYTAMKGLSASEFIYQPKDNSFIAYFVKSSSETDSISSIVYIPKTGLEKSSYSYEIDEKFTDLSIVSLEHSVIVGTKNNGLLTIWSKNYLYNGKDTLVDFYPFQPACSGIPSFSSLSSEISKDDYNNFKLYYNGKDIVCATAVVNNELQKRIAFLSTSYLSGGKTYEIGQFFMPAGNPDYELEVLSSEEYTYSKVISSVPQSSIDASSGETNWNYVLKEVDVVSDTEIVTSEYFQTSANYMMNSDAMFDYSSTKVEGNLEIGSYAFIQFEKYGLAKCYVGDIYSNDKMVKFTSTGPINKFDGREKTWNHVELSEVNSNLKGNAVAYEQLKTINSPSDCFIYGVVNEHNVDELNFKAYDYFTYVEDGNTKIWRQIDVSDIIDGNIASYEELTGLGGVENKDVYLCKTSSSNTGSNYLRPIYSFYKYFTGGNIASWDYILESNYIDGRITNYSELSAKNNVEKGNIYFCNNSYDTEAVSFSSCNFYIYYNNDIDVSHKSNTFTWNSLTGIGKKNDQGEYTASYVGYTNSIYELMNVIENKWGLTDGHIYVLKNDDAYNGTSFSKGTFFLRKASETTSTVPKWLPIDLNSYVEQSFVPSGGTYYGTVDNFDQLTHLSVPQEKSVYLVIDAYSRASETLPGSSFYKYRYEGNQLNWYEYDINSIIRGTVDTYEDLKEIKTAEKNDVYCVRNTHQENTITHEADKYYKYNIDGNTRHWDKLTLPYEKIKGYSSTYTNLSSISSPTTGDIYYIKASYHSDSDIKNAHTFYRYETYGNVKNWFDITYGQLNNALSGYRDSYVEIENLSGDIGSFYFTQDEFKGLDFYKYSRNNNIKTCRDVSFDVVNYSEDLKQTIYDLIDFTGTDSSKYFISGKSALKSIYYCDDLHQYSESFSTFPLSDRSIIKEPVFSTVKSKEVELLPITSYSYALDIPVKKSMAVSVKNYKIDNINHDAVVSLVKWNNSNGTFDTTKNYSNETESISGLYLQYNGICTDVYMNGNSVSQNTNETNRSYYSSTIYEYPHPCYGEFRTAGTGLPIFEGPLSGDMMVSDIVVLNDYLIVKNYNVGIDYGKTISQTTENVLKYGKSTIYDTGYYPSGGYVVTNFYSNNTSNTKIPSLYDSKLVFSSKEDTKTTKRSETIEDYSYMWHIKPVKPIEFYPESFVNKVWFPYYASKYVDFIKYNNGYYYIGLREYPYNGVSSTGYELIETDDLFTEKNCISLKNGLIVSDVRFFDNYGVVQYSRRNNSGTGYVVDSLKWFECGNASYKVYPMSYSEETVTSEISSINRARLDTTVDYSNDVTAKFDNVEVLNSINRFTPIVNHKSNIFSIKIEDLGLDESQYLTDYQKKVLKSWFKNKITDIVDSVKPAHTQLFDVYIN